MADLSYWNARAPISSRPSLQSIRPICALKNASSPMVFSVVGNFHIGETAGVRECARVDALQAFGEHDAIDGIVAPEGVFGDGLHRHAADGLGIST